MPSILFPPTSPISSRTESSDASIPINVFERSCQPRLLPSQEFDNTFPHLTSRTSVTSGPSPRATAMQSAWNKPGIVPPPKHPQEAASWTSRLAQPAEASSQSPTAAAVRKRCVHSLFYARADLESVVRAAACLCVMPVLPYILRTRAVQHQVLWNGLHAVQRRPIFVSWLHGLALRETREKAFLVAMLCA